jgi:hypothetical protein
MSICDDCKHRDTKKRRCRLSDYDTLQNIVNWDKMPANFQCDLHEIGEEYD